MGREAICHAKFGRQSGEGKVLLETDDLLFRGEFRVTVPLKDISAANVRNGVLTVEWPDGRLALTLGRSADTWAQAITSPKTVVEKLGVKPGMKVVLVGRFETSFRTDVMNALGENPGVKPVAGCD